MSDLAAIENAVMAAKNELIEAARDAIAYALRRVGTDPEFAYHMLHTETLERLIRAYAAIEGRPAADVSNEIRSRVGALPESSCSSNRAFIDDGGRI